jgi:hypothetical protein
MASIRAFHRPVGFVVSLVLLSACGLLSTPEPLPTLFLLEDYDATQAALDLIDPGAPTLPPSWTPAAEPVVPATAVPEGQAAPEGQATPQAPSGGSSPVTTTDLGNGWMRYEVAFGNYSIDLPQDWVYVDIRPEMWADSKDLLEEIVPEGAAYVESNMPAYFSYGVDFIAYAETIESGSRDFYSNAIVFSEFGGQAASLGDLADEDLEAIAFLFGTENFTYGRVTLPGGESVRMEYKFIFPAITGEDVDTGGIIYVLVEGGYMYIIELSTTVGQLDSSRSTFQQVAESFRVLE